MKLSGFIEKRFVLHIMTKCGKALCATADGHSLFDSYWQRIWKAARAWILRWPSLILDLRQALLISIHTWCAKGGFIPIISLKKYLLNFPKLKQITFNFLRVLNSNSQIKPIRNNHINVFFKSKAAVDMT